MCMISFGALCKDRIMKVISFFPWYKTKRTTTKNIGNGPGLSAFENYFDKSIEICFSHFSRMTIKLLLVPASSM